MATNVNDMTTVDDVADWLGITSPTQATQDRLQQLITAVSYWILKRIDRPTILSHAVIETRDGGGGQQMIFGEYPVTAIGSVAVNTTTITEASTVGATGYRYNTDKIVLTGHEFTEGFANITLSYTAGYTTVPFDLAQACVELVAFRWKEKERIGYVSKTLAGETVTFNVKDVPSSVQTTLDRWRRVVPV